MAAKLAQDRHIANMKEQLMKVAYSTSFNSPHRLSQHTGPNMSVGNVQVATSGQASINGQSVSA
jgi:hypothetical protein